MHRIAFIGFGEVGYNLAKGLGAEGISGICAYDIAWDDAVDGALIESRSKDADVRLMRSPEELMSAGEVIVQAVPATSCLEAGYAALPFARNDHLFVDVSTASPKDKRLMSKLFAGKGTAYADSAMMGSVPGPRHKVPMIACGAGAQAWCDLMTPYHMRIRVIEGDAGRATEIKLTRSIFMKGIEALLLETFIAARKCGIEDTIMESLSESMDGKFFEHAKDLMLSDAIHAKRRAHEARESARLIEELGITPLITPGTAQRLEWSAHLGLRERFGGVQPASLEELYKAWTELA